MLVIFSYPFFFFLTNCLNNVFLENSVQFEINGRVRGIIDSHAVECMCVMRALESSGD